MRTGPPLTKGETTRAQILNEALRIASRDGLSGITIGELAKSVGMSKSGLFAHFKGKDELELEVLKKAVEQFVDRVLRPSFQKDPGLPRLKALVDHWIDYLNGRNGELEGSVIIAASIELDDRPGPSRDFVQNAQRELILNLEKAAKIAVKEGHLRKDLDSEQFAWSLYSFVLGYHHFLKLLQHPDAEKLFRRSWKGLLKVATEGGESRSQTTRLKVNRKSKFGKIQRKKQ